MKWRVYVVTTQYFEVGAKSARDAEWLVESHVKGAPEEGVVQTSHQLDAVRAFVIPETP